MLLEEGYLGKVGEAAWEGSARLVGAGRGSGPWTWPSDLWRGWQGRKEAACVLVLSTLTGVGLNLLPLLLLPLRC